MSGTKTNTNPKVKKFTFGVSSIWTVNMYPLSMADYDDVFDALILTVSKSCQDISELDDLPDLEMIKLMKNLASDNLNTIASKVFRKQDIPKDPAFEIDADQFVEFTDNLWRQNFETSLKNGQSLFKKIKDTLALKRPSTSSSQDTQDTD